MPKSKTAPERAAGKKKNPNQYTAADIEVLEGLEPVRRRPGMYIGGTDERALHHLAAELLDNAMDEAVAGHAGRISLDLDASGAVTVTDNGRGVPIDPHPKFKNKTALEVILTTLHSGGKFTAGVYETSGGLHGVGLSVVNALSEHLRVEVARGGDVHAQEYKRGAPTGPLKKIGQTPNRRGTKVTFRPDPQIFGHDAKFRPAHLHRMARSKAYLFKGVEIRWSCAKQLLNGKDAPPAEEMFKFPGGLADFLGHELAGRTTLTHEAFAGSSKMNGEGRVEWAAAWPADDGGDGFFSSYCNTVPTPEGGTHEAGFRAAVLRGLKAHAERVNFKAAQKITAEDAVGPACVMLSVFLRDPQFQGQTKERLSSASAQRLVENAVRDHFEHWLSADAEGARALLDAAAERADGRLQKRREKETKRQSATRRLRLPGKLADCTRNSADGTELFIVEGDSAGGSAKQARQRATQAVLPLRGKILNVASAGAEKLRANKELSDLVEALGCGAGAAYDGAKLRYEKIIIMTDADVDGAHIASLLMTFFFLETPKLVESGKLFLAQPPLYRLTQGGKNVYALDDADRARIEKNVLTGRGKIDISRFKGLGEMPAAQLRDTTMAPETRRLLRVTLPKDAADKTAARLVEDLMGKKPERRFAYIQEHAKFVSDIDV
ncbi:MAG: DNA topoisomerase IV subunit B [Rhodospirillales bacterium]